MSHISIKIDFTGAYILAAVATVVLLILKLTKQMVIGWLWVFSPLLGVVALYVLFFVIAFIILIINRIANGY
jgi:phosphate/sulfate permease